MTEESEENYVRVNDMSIIGGTNEDTRCKPALITRACLEEVQEVSGSMLNLHYCGS